MRAKRLVGASVAVLFAALPAILVAAEDTATRGSSKDTVHRASAIMGMTVKNEANRNLGEVNDIVVDVTSGDVQYLAISYGGFLGVGDKLFAVPVDVFKLRQGDSADEYYLTLAVDEQTLKNAPGFDQDKWPDFANRSWTDKVNAHYDKYRRERTDRDGADIDVRAGESRISVDVDADRDRTRRDNQLIDRERRNIDRERSQHVKDTIHRASEIVGMTVKNDANKELGDVEDVVIDLDQGQVKYLALSYGGLLGLGDKLFAVPFDAFECRQGDEQDEYFLVVNVDEQTLKNAPGFDQDSWPNFADSRWDDDLKGHYKDTKNRRAATNRTNRTER